MQIPRKVAIIYNSSKPLAPYLVEQLDAYLTDKLIQVYQFECRKSDESEVDWHTIDMIVTLGGDGTFLEAVRFAYKNDIPLIGVNLGKLGFLADLTEKDLFPAMEKILLGKYKLEERTMINAKVYSNGYAETASFDALNDVVISRATAYSHSISIESYIDGSFLGTYKADGLIIATSTGSTAYSLSANGPIVSPGLNVMVACPICPHTLAVRPLIISEKETYSANFHTDNVEVSLTYDGINGAMLKTGDKVKFRVSPHKVKIININDVSFYELLRKKLGWV